MAVDIPENEFSRIFNLDNVTKKSSKISIETSIEERLKLAKRFSIPEISSLKANCAIEKLTQKKSGDFRLSVSMHAHLVRQCVVTLNDINESIEENFTIVFIINSQNKEIADDKVVEFTVDEDDFELIEDYKIDLGEYVAEYLSLSMSSYPRQAEVSAKEYGFKILEENEVASELEKRNPFNVLESLKH